MDPQARLGYQKRRAVNAYHYKVLQDEVDRLLKIRSSENPTTLTS